MHIAILGGSFDPPHFGHLLIAQQIKRHLNIDQIWLMPCFTHPFHKNLASPTHRLAMTKLLENEDIKVSDFEIKQKNTSYTIHTLTTLRQMYPQDTFYWVIGSDQIDSFTKWRKWQEILTDYPLIIYARGRSPETLEVYIKQTLNLENIPQKTFVLKAHNLPTSHISSTDIRERVKKGLPIRTLIPSKVEEYIKTHNLYIQ